MHYKYVCFYIFNFQTLLEHRYTHVYVALLAVQNIYLPFLNKILKFNLTRICDSFSVHILKLKKMTKNKLYKQKIGTLHLETIRLRVILFRPPPPLHANLFPPIVLISFPNTNCNFSTVLYTVEFQKRGLLHRHNIFWVSTDT
jgi:hypothetical protein